jgi:lipopolysaccharide export system permease protein
MTTPELGEYIDKQKLKGFANTKSFEIEYHKRIAMSFAAFILTIIGVSLSSRKMKGGMGLSLGIGIALSFSYILFQGISSAFAEQMPIALAVWLPNIIYSLVAIVLYIKAPK